MLENILRFYKGTSKSTCLVGDWWDEEFNHISGHRQKKTTSYPMTWLELASSHLLTIALIHNRQTLVFAQTVGKLFFFFAQTGETSGLHQSQGSESVFCWLTQLYIWIGTENDEPKFWNQLFLADAVKMNSYEYSFFYSFQQYTKKFGFFSAEVKNLYSQLIMIITNYRYSVIDKNIIVLLSYIDPNTTS